MIAPRHGMSRSLKSPGRGFPRPPATAVQAPCPAVKEEIVHDATPLTVMEAEDLMPRQNPLVIETVLSDELLWEAEGLLEFANGSEMRLSKALEAERRTAAIVKAAKAALCAKPPVTTNASAAAETAKANELVDLIDL